MNKQIKKLILDIQNIDISNNPPLQNYNNILKFIEKKDLKSIQKIVPSLGDEVFGILKVIKRLIRKNGKTKDMMIVMGMLLDKSIQTEFDYFDTSEPTIKPKLFDEKIEMIYDTTINLVDFMSTLYMFEKEFDSYLKDIKTYLSYIDLSKDLVHDIFDMHPPDLMIALILKLQTPKQNEYFITFAVEYCLKYNYRFSLVYLASSKRIRFEKENQYFLNIDTSMKYRKVDILKDDSVRKNYRITKYENERYLNLLRRKGIRVRHSKMVKPLKRYIQSFRKIKIMMEQQEDEIFFPKFYNNISMFLKKYDKQVFKKNFSTSNLFTDIENTQDKSIIDQRFYELLTNIKNKDVKRFKYAFKKFKDKLHFHIKVFDLLSKHEKELADPKLLAIMSITLNETLKKLYPVLYVDVFYQESKWTLSYEKECIHEGVLDMIFFLKFYSMSNRTMTSEAFLIDIKYFLSNISLFDDLIDDIFDMELAEDIIIWLCERNNFIKNEYFITRVVNYAKKYDYDKLIAFLEKNDMIHFVDEQQYILYTKNLKTSGKTIKKGTRTFIKKKQNRRKVVRSEFPEKKHKSKQRRSNLYPGKHKTLNKGITDLAELKAAEKEQRVLNEVDDLLAEFVSENKEKIEEEKQLVKKKEILEKKQKVQIEKRKKQSEIILKEIDLAVKEHDCQICMESMKLEKMAFCPNDRRHMFHDECIHAWREQKDKQQHKCTYPGCGHLQPLRFRAECKKCKREGTLKKITTCPVCRGDIQNMLKDHDVFEETKKQLDYFEKHISKSGFTGDKKKALDSLKNSSFIHPKFNGEWLLYKKVNMESFYMAFIKGLKNIQDAKKKVNQLNSTLKIRHAFNNYKGIKILYTWTGITPDEFLLKADGKTETNFKMFGIPVISHYDQDKLYIKHLQGKLIITFEKKKDEGLIFTMKFENKVSKLFYAKL